MKVYLTYSRLNNSVWMRNTKDDYDAEAAMKNGAFSYYQQISEKLAKFLNIRFGFNNNPEEDYISILKEN